MKKSITSMILSLSVLSPLMADSNPNENSCSKVEQSFGYFDVGLNSLGLLAPSLGLGWRCQNQHNGFDAALSVSTNIWLTEVKAKLHYLVYVHPSLKSQFYLGLGAGVGGFFQLGDIHDTCLNLSPEIILGKEFSSSSGHKRFIQAEMSIPTFQTQASKVFKHGHHDTLYQPIVALTYGMSF